MAHRIEAPAVTVPAGTAIATPATFPLVWQDGEVDVIEVEVPPGPVGLVGFAIGQSQQVILPRTAGQWIVADGRRLRFDLEGQPTGGGWFLRAYNVDFYDHTLYLTVHLTEINLVTVAAVPRLDIRQPEMPQVVVE